MIKANPFTPQSGWEPKSFQGRKNNISGFMKNISDSITTGRPNHMVVLGDWGIGKTSLLKLFKKVAQQEGILSSYCPVPKITEHDNTADMINVIIEEILKGMPIVKPIKKILSEIEGFGLSIAGFGGEISRKKKTPSPQFILTEVLTQLWTHLKVKMVVILIDDIQNCNEVPQVLDILRLVLSRDEIIAKTNYLFILSSTPRGWDNFIDKHDPIGRFFRKKEEISSLNQEETTTVIKETLVNSGVKFSSDIIELIYQYTNGHPYELQVLCSNLYETQIKGQVSDAQWESAFKTTLRKLGQEYFNSLYRKATDREETILQVLSTVKQELNIKDIQAKLKIYDRKYPVDDTRFYIYRLINKGLIYQGERGKYRLIDKMFKEYIKTLS